MVLLKHFRSIFSILRRLKGKKVVVSLHMTNLAVLRARKREESYSSLPNGFLLSHDGNLCTIANDGPLFAVCKHG